MRVSQEVSQICEQAETDRQTDRQIDRQTDKRTYIQIGRQIHRPTYQALTTASHAPAVVNCSRIASLEGSEARLQMVQQAMAADILQ